MSKKLRCAGTERLSRFTPDLHLISFEHSELASYLGSIFPLFSTAFTPVYGVLLETIGRKAAMVVAGVLYGQSLWALNSRPGADERTL